VTVPDIGAREPTIQQLRCFLVLAEELHFGRAAERLHISQPPLSRHIQSLESAVGVRLLDRAGRRVDLTPAGEVFRRECEQVLRRLDRGVRMARQVASGQAGDLVIGYVEPVGIDLLPRVLGDFRVLHPDHTLRLVEMHTLAQVEALSDGRIDCALLRTTTSSSADLEFDTVWKDELVIALSERHALARPEVDRLPLSKLMDEPLVVYENSLGVGMLTATLAACSDAGFSPTIAHTASSTPMLLSLVAGGEGVALVSSEIAKVPRPGIVFRTIDGPRVTSDVLMGWRRNEYSPALADLRQLLRTKSLRR
jgi:DNA-binding transcriptional LysR family regulator